MCVPNIKSESFFVWPGGVTQTKHIQAYIQPNERKQTPFASRGFCQLFYHEFSLIEEVKVL